MGAAEQILQDLKKANRILDNARCPHCGQPLFNNPKKKEDS